MGTHAQLGVKHRDGSINGTYVHYDGYPDHMLPAIEKFIQRFTTSGLTVAILRASQSGGYRFFDSSGDLTDNLLADDYPSKITAETWADDWYGASHTYLVDYETGKVNYRNKYEQEV
jgi:hypothetical protein